jgi:hypothetical protein
MLSSIPFDAVSKVIPMFGGLFTALDMLIRYNASASEVAPSLKRLEIRLRDLLFLLASIHEYVYLFIVIRLLST